MIDNKMQYLNHLNRMEEIYTKGPKKLGKSNSKKRQNNTLNRRFMINQSTISSKQN